MTSSEYAELKQYLDRRFDGVDHRLDDMDHRLQAIERRLDALDQQFVVMAHRFDTLDRRLDRLEARMDSRFAEVVEQMEGLYGSYQRLEQEYQATREALRRNDREHETHNRRLVAVEGEITDLRLRVDALERRLPPEGV